MPNAAPVTSNLKIAAINVNSIRANQRRLELLQFLDRYNHDIVLISETKINSQHSLTFSNYDVIRTDRPNSIQGGGTAIIIRKNIQYESISIPSSINNEIVKFLIIKLIIGNHKILFIVSIYAGNDGRRMVIDEINHLFESLKLYYSDAYYIIAGDLNALHKSWGDRDTNQRGRYLKQWETSHNIRYKLRVLTPIAPTYKLALLFLDVCLADSKLEFLDGTNGKLNILPCDSDHAAITFTFGFVDDGVIRDNPAAPSFRHNFKSTKWEKFSKKLAHSYSHIIPDNRNLTLPEIDKGLQVIGTAIQNTIALVVPKILPTDNVSKYVNRKITKLQKTKRHLVSLLHDLHINDSGGRLRISSVAKNALKNVNSALYLEFEKASEKFWIKQIKK